MIKVENSLKTLILTRIFFFSLLAMTYQLAFIFFRYWNDMERIERLLVIQETKALATGIGFQNGEVTYTLPENLNDQFENNKQNYLTRIRDESKVLYSNCQSQCDKYFLPLQNKTPDYWVDEYTNFYPLRISGGKREHAFSKTVTIEYAIVKDTLNRINIALISEVGRTLLIPMGLMTVFVIGAMSLSIISALRPIERAAKLLENVETGTSYTSLTLDNIPTEIASFVTAVKKAFGKLEELIRKQRIYTTAISHEVRTPLTVCRLELENIEDPRARKVEQDLESLTDLVSQLTDLARIDAVGSMITEKVNPLSVAEKVVGDLAPLAYNSGKSLSLEDKVGEMFRGHPALIENALRNLVQNAIKHTGPSAAITVEVGPGRKLTVIDDGGHRMERTNKTDKIFKKGDRGEFGLKIINKICELHEARFELKSNPDEGGTVAQLIFKF